MYDIETKPCPFCGSKAEIVRVHQPWSDTQPRFFATCLVCGAEMARNSRTIGEAIQAWNRRADNA